MESFDGADENFAGEFWLFIQQCRELTPVQNRNRHVGVGGSGGRAWHAGNDSEFAEKVAGADLCEDTSLPTDGGITLHDDQKLPSCCTFDHQITALLDGNRPHQPADGLALPLAELGEQFDCLEVLVDRQ